MLETKGQDFLTMYLDTEIGLVGGNTVLPVFTQRYWWWYRRRQKGRPQVLEVLYLPYYSNTRAFTVLPKQRDSASVRVTNIL